MTFNGVAGTQIQSIFSSVANKGLDTDALTSALENGALSFAMSSAALFTSSALAFGADGAAATGSQIYALTVAAGGASGLTLTDGAAITLTIVNGIVIGTVGTDLAHPSLQGQVAFAIAIDPLTGKTYVAQYLSMHQDSATGTPNDGVTFAANSVGITLTLKDGDSDTVTSNTVDISTHITFLDDGPSVIVPELAVMLNTVGQTFTGSLNEIFGSVSNVNYGVDGGDTHFVLSGLPSNLTSNGHAIVYDISNGGHTLTGYVDTNGVAGYQVGVDTAIFTALLTLDSGVNAATDQYSISMSGTIDGGAQNIDFSSNLFNFVGSNLPWSGFTSPTNGLLITPLSVSGGGTVTSAGTINGTANALGTNNTSIGSGEGIRLDYITALGGTGSPGKDYSVTANETETYTGHY